jgi:hypothetical protein
LIIIQRPPRFSQRCCKVAWRTVGSLLLYHSIFTSAVAAWDCRTKWMAVTS